MGNSTRGNQVFSPVKHTRALNLFGSDNEIDKLIRDPSNELFIVLADPQIPRGIICPVKEAVRFVLSCFVVVRFLVVDK
jgi:hypothetical protein